MRRDIRDRWVAALRSGEYTQGDGYLRTGDGTYCCLGVLCELAVADGVLPEPVLQIGWPHERYGYGEMQLEGDTPVEVLAWAELPLDNAYVAVEVDGFGTELAQLNDDGEPFARIADIIEENL